MIDAVSVCICVMLGETVCGCVVNDMYVYVVERARSTCALEQPHSARVSVSARAGRAFVRVQHARVLGAHSHTATQNARVALVYYNMRLVQRAFPRGQPTTI